MGFVLSYRVVFLEVIRVKKIAWLLVFAIFLLPFSAWAGDGHYEKNKNQKGLTVVNDVLVVNKTHALPKDYRPLPKGQGQEVLYGEAAKAFVKMQKEAKKEGISLFLCSGYRDYDYQAKLFNQYAKTAGKDRALTYSAPPGFSEHQSGLAADIGDRAYPEITLEKAFGQTKAGTWLVKNAYRFGFILRYPEGAESRTGYQYEPWHFRYVGVQVAKDLKKYPQATLEAYLGISHELGRYVAHPKPVTLALKKSKLAVQAYEVDKKRVVAIEDMVALGEKHSLDLKMVKDAGQGGSELVFAKTKGAKPLAKARGMRTAIPCEELYLNGFKLPVKTWIIDGKTYIEPKVLGEACAFEVQEEKNTYTFSQTFLEKGYVDILKEISPFVLLHLQSLQVK